MCRLGRGVEAVLESSKWSSCRGASIDDADILNSLANAELHMTLAALFSPTSKLNFELYETDASDLEFKHDFFAPHPRLDSKGVRVRVVEPPKS
jgi:hypothetical protein